MKDFRYLFLFFIFIVLFENVSQAATLGSCLAIETSKRYIDVDFSAPYPKQASFRCQYVCQGALQQETILGTSVVHLSSLHEEATRTTCQGIHLSKTEFGYELESIRSFYAHDTKIVEIKAWAEKEIQHQSPLEAIYLEKLKQNLTYVVTNYLMMDPLQKETNGVKQAIVRLRKIISELPEGDETLEIELEHLLANDGKIPSIPDSSFWTWTPLLSNAAWRLPWVQ
ncbi:MAG: hypothetical protein KDD61_13830 [Bdellovibrionales bacterium]|nr:hypothetical protein [Bdellovibrionales bacterium]